MTVYEKMKSGVLYDCTEEAMSEELNRKLLACKELLYDFNHTRPSDGETRLKIIEKLFARVGQNCYIEITVERR